MIYLSIKKVIHFLCILINKYTFISSALGIYILCIELFEEFSYVLVSRITIDTPKRARYMACYCAFSEFLFYTVRPNNNPRTALFCQERINSRNKQLIISAAVTDVQLTQASIMPWKIELFFQYLSLIVLYSVIII